MTQRFLLTSFLHLPSHELENPLHRVLVEAQQMRHRPLAKGRMFLDHLFDRATKSVPALSFELRGTVARCDYSPSS